MPAGIHHHLIAKLLVASSLFIGFNVLAAQPTFVGLVGATYQRIEPFRITEIRSPIIQSAEQISAARVLRQASVVLAEADEHGLESSVYGDAALGQFLGDLLDREMHTASVEHAKDYARRALLALAVDLKFGHQAAKLADIEHLRLQVELAMEEGAVHEWFATLSPRHTGYRQLQASLTELQQIQVSGGWQVINEGRTLQLGSVGPRVAQLRQRLGVSGPDLERYDESLQQALITYQVTHGLDADGKLGRRTLGHLNIPIEARIRQVKLNLRRWRQMPIPAEGTYVHVNIPEYKLDFLRKGQVELSMRVIVGDEDSPTPAIKDSIEYLVFNPYWDIPRGIAIEEMLPKIARDPSYLQRQRLEIMGTEGPVAPELVDFSALNASYFPYKLRQKPGKKNSLGLVKFIFPNPFNVYLHDTPTDSLFDRTRRALSHGCVRLEQPAELAAALLSSQQDWSLDKVTSTMGNNIPDYVALDEPIPVFITYLTVGSSDDGKVRFHEDIYERDLGREGRLASARLAPFPVVEQLRVAAR